MRIIHKQELNYRAGDHTIVELPINSTVLSCDFQGDKLVIWYMFDTDEKGTVKRIFYTFRTGEHIPYWVGSFDFKFVGTAYDRNIEFPFVIHVFELLKL